MEETKHTPGPWRVSKITNDVSVCGQRIDCFEVESPKDCCWIAQVQNHTACTATEPGNANAHLIAAAPDLLKACKEAIPWICLATARDPETTHPQALVNAKEDLDLAMKAIAKAEGRND